MDDFTSKFKKLLEIHDSTDSTKLELFKQLLKEYPEEMLEKIESIRALRKLADQDDPMDKNKSAKDMSDALKKLKDTNTKNFQKEYFDQYYKYLR